MGGFRALEERGGGAWSLAVLVDHDEARSKVAEDAGVESARDKRQGPVLHGGRPVAAALPSTACVVHLQLRGGPSIDANDDGVGPRRRSDLIVIVMMTVI